MCHGCFSRAGDVAGALGFDWGIRRQGIGVLVRDFFDNWPSCVRAYSRRNIGSETE